MKRNTVKPLHKGRPWGQKKVAVVERRPLWEGRGVTWQFFSGEYDMFITLSSCLPSPRMLLSFSTLTYSAQFLNVRHNN